MNRTETDSGIGSDAWMTKRGFRPMTPEESKKHARFFLPCGEESTGGGKIIDLVRCLQEALARRKRR